MGKKAVSPLIAIVLLIVFTVAISTLIIAWMTEYTKTTTEAASSGTSGVVSCATQTISISDVSITPNTDTVTQFNDSETSKTFSSPTGSTDTVWVRLPKNATVTQSALTIEGQAYE